MYSVQKYSVTKLQGFTDSDVVEKITKNNNGNKPIFTLSFYVSLNMHYLYCIEKLDLF